MSEQTDPVRLQALIIGAGFAGIGMARALRQLGIDDFLLVDRGDRPGGVWQANRYPGAACDVPSHLYSFSFAPATHWSRRYGPQAEIRQYLENCLDRFECRSQTLFNTEIASAHWDSEQGHWLVRDSTGRCWQTRWLFSAVGQLSQPQRPKIEGIDEFAGPVVHSAQWPEDLQLNDQRVAVIGSGASAIQFVPAILPAVRQLTLFQRSAPYVLPKPDGPYSRAQQQRFRNWPILQRLSRWAQYLSHEARGMVLLHSPLLLRGYRWYFERGLSRQIADPALRDRLRPTEALGCKRVLFSNDWYAALADPRTTVVSDGISRIHARGVVDCRGNDHPADVLILGTGFQATRFLSPLQIHGSDGLELNQAWRNGAQAYLGMCMPGFPNFFMLYGPNTNLGHNSIVFMLECQIRYATQALGALNRSPQRSMQIRRDIHQRYQNGLERRLQRSVWSSGCHSWYHDEHGRITTNWPGSTVSYAWATRRFRPDQFEYLDLGARQ